MADQRHYTVDELYRAVCSCGLQPASVAPGRVACALAAALDLPLDLELPKRVRFMEWMGSPVGAYTIVAGDGSELKGDQRKRYDCAAARCYNAVAEVLEQFPTRYADGVLGEVLGILWSAQL